MKNIALPIIAIVAITLLIAACGGNGDSGSDVGGGEEPTVSTADDEGGGEEPTVSFGEPAVPFAESCQKTDEKQFSAAPEPVIDTSKTYTATIKMESGGEIVIELFSDVPITTNNFVFLACKGYYDGVTFHRVIPDFVAQGGDPTGTGTGGPGYSIPDEEDGDHGMDAGVISMAKSGPNTTGSQFFITYTPQKQLEPDFTVFGRVTEGMDVALQITPRTAPSLPPGDAIETITIEER